jgi:excinuclease ABC subunit A
MSGNDIIILRNARENNLRSLSLDIPKHKLIVITGVSGSGKSSLVFDVINRAAESQYLGSFSTHAQNFLGKLRHPDVEVIEGLSPSISIDQHSIQKNPRSTVGTLTGIYDHLRLLFARCGEYIPGETPFKIDRSLFSFNSPSGACPVCKGLGVEDSLDPELLVADPTKSLRDRALVITAPNGYIIYSQVTMDVLDQVCRAEGFTVDIPWKDLTQEQKNIVLYGSAKIEIPFGKHTLESRMRWSGITAKPREMGFYKGIIPIMEEILKRDRNKNILRFVRIRTCRSCNGSRLNTNALSILLDGVNIAELSALQVDQLENFLGNLNPVSVSASVSKPIVDSIVKRLKIIRELGLGYLSLDREAGTLSGGESQRLRLAVQTGTGLRNILYLFDEPSIGLHSRDTQKVLTVLKKLRDQGNTVIVVEHEEAFIHAADWLIDIGPGAGIYGGEVVFNIPVERISELTDTEIRKSRTLSYFKGIEKIDIPAQRRNGEGFLNIQGASAHNLKNISVSFKLKTLNAVSGVSGAGKSTLVQFVLGNFLRQKIHGAKELPGQSIEISGWENIKKIISIDQSPIGRTSRSNPATYTGLFDFVRDLFASQPLAKMRGYDKGRFSFNTAGGRCEACEGSGYQEIGMHFMGNVEVVCEKCDGLRFDNETLEVTYNSKNINEVLDLFISEAREFFRDQPRILRFLTTLDDLGLGYLKLGQRSSTLSGGEAQRIKLATELAKPGSGHTLYILDEPTTGLHQADVRNLLLALNNLVEQGNTVLFIEHHMGLLAAADHIVDLGPESGNEGGFVVASGTPEQVMEMNTSWTGKALKEYFFESINREKFSVSGQLIEHEPEISSVIKFTGITTHNLKNVEVRIPHNRITVLTGVSGSGKSSLAFDTLYAEGKNRYMESFSTYARTQIGMKEKPDFEDVSGLTPVLAVDQRAIGDNPRSTVGTMTGIYDLYRLLYSRIGISELGSDHVHSSLFSFNHQSGACPVCDGLGTRTVCDPEKLVTNPEKSILDGAMNGTKTGKFYGDPFGQYVATLKAVGKKNAIDFSCTWFDLSLKDRQVAMYGTKNEVYAVSWQYKRGERAGEHSFSGIWQGLAELVNEEYNRKHSDHRGKEMLPLMMAETCPECKGQRLCKEALSFRINGETIASLSALSIDQSFDFFEQLISKLTDPVHQSIAAPIVAKLTERLSFISGMGLPYLSPDRISSTLSGGEAQRIKLAGQMGSGLTGITYILDEPTIGLHPSDVSRLMKMIVLLREQGNTIVIVEHDREVILSADHVIDLGPGAGSKGGNILASGTPQEIKHNPDSVTGRYLESAVVRSGRNRLLSEGISIRNATANNLKGFDLEVPSGGIIAITGVSGSGKSSLLLDVIYESYIRNKPIGCKAIEGVDRFDKIVVTEQKASFTNPAGTPVTFTGIFDRIRDLFSKTPDAEKLKLGKNHFSYISKEGRCETCQGMGKIRISMDFLPDVWNTCETCHGRRYKEEILHIRYRGKTIADILDMDNSEAMVFFIDHVILKKSFSLLEQTGLGYLRLGQPLDTLSGGEAQRLTLAAELMKAGKGKILYLFEEPSTGLHFQDIRFLLQIFHNLVDQGHTVLLIEHDLQIISQSDWVIDLGPGGGDKGGNVVFSGTVPAIMNHPESVTGKFLRSYLTLNLT